MGMGRGGGRCRGRGGGRRWSSGVLRLGFVLGGLPLLVNGGGERGCVFSKGFFFWKGERGKI